MKSNAKKISPGIVLSCVFGMMTLIIVQGKLHVNSPIHPDRPTVKTEISVNRLLGRFDYKKDSDFIAVEPGFCSKPMYLQKETYKKFKEMYALREKAARDAGMELIVHQNPEAIARGINPFDHGSLHTDMWKTEGLKQALDTHGFDVAFGGARRDEEKSRAKERIFSFRTATHGWDPKNQRPELWNLYNTRKAKSESIRVFPISNWTELDIWQYIHLENIEIVPLYFSAPRPTVTRDGMLLMIDDERFPLQDGEVPVERSIRFRTLGCYPLTGAVESTASTLPEVIQEMLLTTTSERQGRAIDHDQAASMEKKKQEGYF